MRAFFAVGASVFVGFALACAPVYTPAGAHLSMLEQQGDLHLQGGLGIEGLQLAGAYAVSNHVSARALAQVSRIDDNKYDHASLGVGAFHASDDGLRVSLDYDAGPSLAVGNYDNTHLSGRGFRQSLSVGVAFETPNFAVGIVSAPGTYTFWHDDQSTHQGRDWMSFDETNIVLRAGSEKYKFDAHIGVWIPLGVDPDLNLGVPFPFLFGLGFSADFPTAQLKEEASP